LVSQVADDTFRTTIEPRRDALHERPNLRNLHVAYPPENEPASTERGAAREVPVLSTWLNTVDKFRLDACAGRGRGNPIPVPMPGRRRERNFQRPRDV